VVFFPSAAWYLSNELDGCDSVLDLGCGDNSVLRYIPHTFWSVGIDAWKDSIIEAQRKHIHDEYVLADIAHLELKEDSVDAVILLEFLEHMTKEEGTALIEILSKVARKKIVLTTPSGFIPQDDEQNPFQLHKSGWEIDELRKLGFTKFRGVGGLKALGRKFDRQISFMFVQSIPQKIAYLRPIDANGIVCTKFTDRR
jgi:SAM-dependent methyltransferase